MYDLQKLENSYLPIDKLIYEYRISMLDVDRYKTYTKYNPNKILFHSYITLSLIKDSEVRHSVRQYISRIITLKEDYGYLYYLNTQKLIVPLHLYFNSELILDPSYNTEIMDELNSLAKQFSCPTKNNKYYEITLIEILYYLTILVNPHLNWITVDYILRGNRTHDYLISFKNRIIQKTWPG